MIHNFNVKKKKKKKKNVKMPLTLIASYSLNLTIPSRVYSLYHSLVSRDKNDF